MSYALKIERATHVLITRCPALVHMNTFDPCWPRSMGTEHPAQKARSDAMPATASSRSHACEVVAHVGGWKSRIPHRQIASKHTTKVTVRHTLSGAKRGHPARILLVSPLASAPAPDRARKIAGVGLITAPSFPKCLGATQYIPITYRRL